jgi:hypothetical protein
VLRREGDEADIAYYHQEKSGLMVGALMDGRKPEGEQLTIHFRMANEHEE